MVECHVCGSRFVTDDGLQKHIVNQHWPASVEPVVTPPPTEEEMEEARVGLLDIANGLQQLRKSLHDE